MIAAQAGKAALQALKTYGPPVAKAAWRVAGPIVVRKAVDRFFDKRPPTRIRRRGDQHNTDW